MRKTSILICSIILAGISFSACRDKSSDEPDPAAPAPSDEIAKADAFAQDALGIYYLWVDDVSKDLERLDPDTCCYPEKVVEAIRYHENGVEVDHWTRLTDDLKSFTNSVQGIGVTYGYSLALGQVSNKSGVYFLLVSYVSNGSPAQAAGLKRGDIIITLNGADITSDNLYDVFNKESITLGVTGIELSSDGSAHIGSDVKSVSLTAVDMYEDPILLSRTFDLEGKKVGYLMYNSFDLKSARALPDVFRQFKSDGIDELILDLRYNGGGYAFTETVLASLIAPKANVDAGDVFQTDVYNSNLAEAMEKYGEDPDTRFSSTFNYNDNSGTAFSVDVSDANPEVSKIYVIVTDGTASASEGLIVGLGPYMDIDLIGRRTYGKYCSGFMLGPDDIYNDKYDYSLISEWGIYVMVSKFADKNGDNASIPDGIVPDLECDDNPLDGHQLGDENETMLKAALTAAGKVYKETSSVAAVPCFPARQLDPKNVRGILIKTDKPPVLR